MSNHRTKKIRLQVAAPCKESWDNMVGSDAERFCGTCKKSVYQLSMMSTAEVEELLASPRGICGRFYQRADGTLMTTDCAPGLRRRRRKQAMAGFGVLSLLGLAGSSLMVTQGDVAVTGQIQAPQVLSEGIENNPGIDELTGGIRFKYAEEEPDVAGEVVEIMGDVMVAPDPEVVETMGEVAYDPAGDPDSY